MTRRHVVQYSITGVVEVEDTKAFRNTFTYREDTYVGEIVLIVHDNIPCDPNNDAEYMAFLKDLLEQKLELMYNDFESDSILISGHFQNRPVEFVPIAAKRTASNILAQGDT